MCSIEGSEGVGVYERTWHGVDFVEVTIPTSGTRNKERTNSVNFRKWKYADWVI